MIIEQIEIKGFEICISFNPDPVSPYKAEFIGNGREDNQSFPTYEAARKWLRDILDLPFLFMNSDDELLQSISWEQLLEYDNTTKAPQFIFFTMQLTADDKHIITIQADGMIRHVDRLKGIEVTNQQIAQLDEWAVSKNGQKLVFIQGEIMEIWDIFSMQRQHTILIPFTPLQATILADDNTVALANSYSWFFPINEDFPFIQFYDLETGRLISQIRVGAPLRDCTLRQVVFSHQKDWVSFGIRYDEMAFERTRQFIVPVRPKPSDQMEHSTLNPINKIKLGLKNRPNFLRIFSKPKQVFRYQGYINDCAQFSHNGKYLFLGINQTNHQIMTSYGPAAHRIHVWKQKNSRKFIEDRWLSGHQAEIKWLFVSFDDRNLISISVDGNIRIWDVTSGQEQHSSTVDIAKPTVAVSDKKGELIAIGNNNGQLIVWHIVKREVVYTGNKHNDKICYLAFTSSSNQLISASVSGTILEWSLNPPSATPKIIYKGNLAAPE